MQNLLTPPFRNELLPDVEWQDYLSLHGLNPSRIIPGLKSMKHLKAADERDEKPQRNLLVGSMTHGIILELDQFDARFAIYTGEGTRRTKAYKEFAEENEGKDVATGNEFAQANATARAVMADPLARELIDATQHEVTILCEDFEMQCKGRIDALGGGLLIDLKTTTSVEDHAFGRVSAGLHYPGKMSCYRRFVQLVTGELCEVKVIAVETKPPYDVVVFNIPDIVLDNAWEQIESKVMRRLRGCIERDEWPGVANGEERELCVPNWAMPEDEALDWSE